MPASRIEVARDKPPASNADGKLLPPFTVVCLLKHFQGFSGIFQYLSFRKSACGGACYIGRK